VGEKASAPGRSKPEQPFGVTDLACLEQRNNQRLLASDGLVSRLLFAQNVEKIALLFFAQVLVVRELEAGRKRHRM
jgi:hypothetical protein